MSGLAGEPLSIAAVIVTHGRPSKLGRCLGSLLASARACPGLRLRIRIGINGWDPASSAVALEASARAGEGVFEILELPEALPPGAARNRISQGERAAWIFFVDDDVYLDEDFFVTFMDLERRHPDASVIGGPNLTPRDSSRFQRASGAALASRLAAARVSRRYSPRNSGDKTEGSGRPGTSCGEESLILCNLFVRANVFAASPFPEDLACAEENHVLDRLRRQGHLLVASSRLFLWHERRETLSGFARQMFKYGFGRGQLLRRSPRSARARHLVPALALPALLIVLVRSLVLGSLGPGLWTVLSVYLFLCILGGLVTGMSLKESRPVALLSGLLHPVVHFSYGAGVLAGVARRR